MSTRRSRKREREAAAAEPARPIVRRRDLLLLAGILLLTAAVYARSLGNEFIYFDDPDAVVNNPWIRELGLANLRRWLTTPVQYMYMPLALLSYAIDYRIAGLDPFAYHLHNLLLHLGCVALVYWVFALLGRRSRPALVVALLFAVHPVNVDSVASVAARTNLLATLFSLVALGCYGRALDSGRRRRWLALSWLAFVLACSAKSAAVVLPLTLLLWDHLRGRRLERRLLLEKLPFFAVALAFGIVALSMRSDAPPPVHYGPLDRALVFLYALAHYCLRLVVPTGLSMSYAYPEKAGAWLPLPYLLAPLLLAAVAWGARKLVSREAWTFGFGFFVVNVALSQSVLLLDGFMANRYAYLAYLGPFWVLAELGERVFEARRADGRPNPWSRVAGGAALFALAAQLAWLARARMPVWHDSLSLFDDVIEKGQGSAWVYGTRGLVKLHGQDLAGARRDLDESLRLDPDYVPGLCYRGVVNTLSHDYAAALADLDRALAGDPPIPGAYRDRGKVKLALHDEDGALADFDRAIALDPSSDARFRRGVLRSQRGDPGGALADFDETIARAPRDGEAWFRRGLAKLALGDRAGACADAAQAERLGYLPPYGEPVPECP